MPCQINNLETISHISQLLLKESEGRLRIYGMNEDSQLHFYDLLGRAIFYRITKKDIEFYTIELLSTSTSPMVGIYNGMKYKL